MQHDEQNELRAPTSAGTQVSKIASVKRSVNLRIEVRELDVLVSAAYSHLENQMKKMDIKSLLAIASIGVHMLATICGAESVVEWRVKDGGNGHWYAAVHASPSKSPEAWFTFATANGGVVASITSSEENSIILSVATQNGRFTWPCIGGKRNTSNVFQWVSGDAWNYTQWSNGEPNCTCEKYLMLYPSGWNDTNSTVRPWAIVEYSADCNGDGIVDFGQIRSGSLLDNNGNNVPDYCEQGQQCVLVCDADIDQTGVVDGVDLAALLGNWGTSGGAYPRADTNQDGIVDGVDLATVLNGWGMCSS